MFCALCCVVLCCVVLYSVLLIESCEQVKRLLYPAGKGQPDIWCKIKLRRFGHCCSVIIPFAPLFVLLFAFDKAEIRQICHYGPLELSLIHI